MAETIDVFLCHNSQEKAAVRTINEVLRQQYGLKTYLDEAALVGGQEWEQAIQGALARAAACAVIVGPRGWGRYQLDREVRPAIQRRQQDASFRVIPVLLPDVDVTALSDFADFFGQTHWVSFAQSPDDAAAIRTLALALRGENAFPEGPPRLTKSRVHFDAIRWDAGIRRDLSLLYTGRILRDAVALAGGPEHPVINDFLTASLQHHNGLLARQLGAHASVMWANPRRRDLAARLALESVRRLPTAEGVEVLRQAYANLQRIVGVLTHPASVTAALRKNDSAGLASGCADGSVCIWDESTLRVVGSHAQAVRAIADLGDGRFVTGASDGTCMVWDWKSGARVGGFAAGPAVETLDVAHGDKQTLLLTCGGFPGRPEGVAVWDAADGRELWRTGMVTHATFDATGTQVVLAWGDHVVTRRAVDGQLTAKQPMGAAVIHVAAHPKQAWVAAVTFDRRASLIAFGSGEPETRELGVGISRVSPIRISRNGRYVAALRDDFRAVMWDLTDWSRRWFKYEGLMSVDLQFSDQDRYLAVISPEAKAVTVWRADDGLHVCTIEQETPSLAMFDDQRNALWAASNANAASLFDMPRQNEALSTATPGLTRALAYGPDGSLAWCGSPVGPDLKVTSGDVALWVADPLTGATRVDTTLAESGRIAFDASGRFVAVVGTTATRFWDLSTGSEAHAPESFQADEPESAQLQLVTALLATEAVAAACIKRGRASTLASSDGRYVAIDHGKQLVSLWDASTVTQVVEFSTSAPIERMAFSPEGTLFATADSRGGVLLWQTDGMPLGQVKHDEPVTHLAFSPDGRFLAVASLDAALRVWIASPRLLAQSVAERVSGPLSDEDWARYLGDEPRAD